MYDSCELCVECVMGGCGRRTVVLKVVERGFVLAVDILQIRSGGPGFVLLARIHNPI